MIQIHKFYLIVDVYVLGLDHFFVLNHITIGESPTVQIYNIKKRKLCTKGHKQSASTTWITWEREEM
jgi:hypothetical protein